MAITISRAFKDISLSFVRNPLTNDILVLRNEDAIKKSVINLVRTRIGERFFNPILGSNIDNSLFELNGYDVSEGLIEEIKVLLSNFEPRIRLNDVNVTPVEDAYELNIQITYTIIGLPLPPQAIEFILQPTRN